MRIRRNVRGTRARWLEMARNNAELGLAHAGLDPRDDRRSARGGRPRAEARAPAARIECFDVSHSMGESAVASCVVFGVEGPIKSDYRRFNLRELTPGDDYAGIRQAVERRFARVLRGEAPMPDLLLIDGGPGQLNAALEALDALGVQGLVVVGVAKGADRRAGQERLFFPGQEAPLILAPDSPALRLIQRIRDEAHRFAITGHRQSRDRTRRESSLEEIPGLGPKRRGSCSRLSAGCRACARRRSRTSRRCMASAASSRHRSTNA